VAAARKDTISMAWSRRIEAICGVAAGALGVITLGAVLFAPLGTQSRCSSALSPDGVTQTDCSTTSMSIVQAQGLEILLPAIILFAAPLIGIAVFALLHSLGRGGLVLLWISVAALCVAMVLAILSIGIFFAPSALLALLAAITGSLPDRLGRLGTPPA
jgi:hypothetical protein